MFNFFTIKPNKHTKKELKCTIKITNLTSLTSVKLNSSR